MGKKTTKETPPPSNPKPTNTTKKQNPNKKPNGLVTAGKPVKLRADAKALQLVAVMALQKNVLRDCLVLLKGITAQE